MSDKKASLRDQARKHRILTDISAEDLDAATTIFFDVIRPRNGQTLAAYWPKGREFDPTGILERALNEGLTCALPKVDKQSKILEFVEWNHDTKLVRGEYGILEPENGKKVSPDIFLVPMLAFDRKGYRLGQGGGYYDATLAHYRARKKIEAIGVAYATQAVLFVLPVENHDQKMDWILTPQGITRHKD